jgi:hypothetical protein
MPPSVHWADVLTSTGNHMPCGLSQALRASRTRPGSTVTVIASRSKCSTRFKCRLWSITSAAPTVCPHCELPAPRGSIGDSARTAFGGAAVDATLGNLFTHPQNRERQVADFRRLVAAAPNTGNLFLVTHGATTLAFTGISPGTAEMVIVTPQRDGQIRVAGRISLAP